MMKCFAVLTLFFCVTVLQAQPFIHAHNDYQKSEPLTNALRNKAWSIEADVFLSGDRLLVAHSKNELLHAQTLDSFYLQPIIKLFNQHKGTISEDTAYAPILMIDIKENGGSAIAALIKLLSAYPAVFNRSVNAKAVQIVISGDRGSSLKWASYPSYLLFDGRPKEQYNNEQLQRIAFISDNWVPYFLPPADVDHERLKRVIDEAHYLRKPIRFWASPDNPDTWRLQKELGIDIINTDKTEECRLFLSKG